MKRKIVAPLVLLTVFVVALLSNLALTPSPRTKLSEEMSLYYHQQAAATAHAMFKLAENDIDPQRVDQFKYRLAQLDKNAVYDRRDALILDKADSYESVMDDITYTPHSTMSVSERVAKLWWAQSQLIRLRESIPCRNEKDVRIHYTASDITTKRGEFEQGKRVLEALLP
jgi:hypothetical protein